MRVVILGNSGSGKSTLARWFASHAGAPSLDLDTVAWEPGKVAVPRAPEVAVAMVRAFCEAHTQWVVEGCYAGLVSATFPFAPRMLFLNPGVDRCIAHCRARPWEPHKYASAQEQDARLDMLLAWVAAYDTREGDLSLKGHRACFEGYAGPRHELTEPLSLDPPSRELLEWAR